MFYLGVFILFLFKSFNIIPFDIAIQKKNYDIQTLLCDFIQNWFTENDCANNHFHCNAETENSNPAPFHINDTKHHIQNHDLFDEENDS